MNAPAPNQVEILGQIETANGAGGVRLIGRFGDGRYQLGEMVERRGGGYERGAGIPVLTFDPLTPAVSYAELAALADNVIAGTEKVTQRTALTLALFVAAVRCEVEFGSCDPGRSASPPSSPLDPDPAGAPAGGTGGDRVPHAAAASFPEGDTA